MAERTWYRVREIAAELDVHPGTVRRWIQTGKLHARGGTPGLLLVHRDDLDEFISTYLPQ